jgi:pimeloyl-ACP methyl ester carboxylesterase
MVCLMSGRRSIHSFLWALLFFVVAVSDFPVFAAEPEQPLVFVPGILGSKLCEGRDVLWGSASSLSNFNKLEIQPNSAGPDIFSCGLVDRISVLGPFWTIHEYDGLIKTLTNLGYKEGSSLFVFHYDWRLSNYDTAKTLQAFINRTPQLTNRKFDIVAHSMGGIATSIYLRQQNGKKRVRTAIYLGTPFAGSMNALATLSNGWGVLQIALQAASPPYDKPFCRFRHFTSCFHAIVSFVALAPHLDFNLSTFSIMTYGNDMVGCRPNFPADNVQCLHAKTFSGLQGCEQI